MQDFQLEPQKPAEPLDAATKAAIEEGREAIRRGEVMTVEQAIENARENYKAWKKNRKPADLPA